MKKPRTDIRVSLRRDRRSRGVIETPEGREVVFNGSSRNKAERLPVSETDQAKSYGLTAETETSALAEREEVTAAEPSKKNKKKRTRKQRTVSGIVALFAAAALALGGYAAWENSPAAITINDKPVCYLKNMTEASKAMQLIVQDNTPRGTAVRAVDVSDSLSIKKTPGFGYKTKSVDKAAQFVRDRYLHTGKAEVITASLAVYQEQYVPDPDIRKDEDMMAGQERLESKAVAGTQEVTKLFSVRNGQSVAIDALDISVVEEGTPAVIYRGTIGLPEGEDWKTYNGMPVYNNGEELITDAKHYLGLKYVWGGFDLNKGVDCVGFVCEMYEKFGIKLPHSHEGLRKVGISVPLSEAKAGDIICYNGHVALYMGDGRIIHATRGKSNNVHISKSVNYNKKRHIITIRRVVGN